MFQKREECISLIWFVCWFQLYVIGWILGFLKISVICRKSSSFAAFIVPSILVFSPAVFHVYRISDFFILSLDLILFLKYCNNISFRITRDLTLNWLNWKYHDCASATAFWRRITSDTDHVNYLVTFKIWVEDGVNSKVVLNLKIDTKFRHPIF